MNKVFSQGVDELITRLEEEGIQTGKQKAQTLIEQAHEKASDIVDRAIQEAQTMVENAKEQVRVELKAGKDALKLAMRDLILDFRSVVISKFQEELGRIVVNVLKNEEMIEKLILLIAKSTQDLLGEYEQEELTLLLKKPPENLLETAKKYPKANSEMNRLANGIAYRILEKGIDFEGLKMFIENQKVTVDFTDEALKEVLMRYLSPRVSALLMGLES